MTDGPIKIGWMLAGCSPDTELGNDDMSWAYDGYYEEKVHSAVCDNYGKRWQVGDVIGVFLDIQDRTISELEMKQSFKTSKNYFGHNDLIS